MTESRKKGKIRIQRNLIYYYYHYLCRVFFFYGGVRLIPLHWFQVGFLCA